MNGEGPRACSGDGLASQTSSGLVCDVTFVPCASSQPWPLPQKMADARAEGAPPLTPKMVADSGDGSGNETSAKNGLETI